MPKTSRDWSYRELDLGGSSPNGRPDLLRGTPAGAHLRDLSIEPGLPGWLWVLSDGADPTWGRVGVGAGFPLTSNVSAGGFRIESLGSPSDGNDAANKDYVDAAVGFDPTTPLAYPYTTTDADKFVKIDTTSSRSIVLGDGTTEQWVTLADVKDLSAANPVTVSLANASKALNGVTNGTYVLSVNGAQRGFYRGTDGHWHGGV